MEQLQSETAKTQTGSPKPQLSESITLRPFDLADVDDMMVWTTDEKVGQFCGWDPTAFTKDYTTDILSKTIIPHPYFRAICINNRPIGEISLRLKTGHDSCRAEIGYVVALDYWGKGIATKAVKMAVSEIFALWPNLERIEATVDVENLGSQRVLEKNGFSREGVLRKYLIHKGRTIDMVMFSLLSTDPKVE